MNISGFFQFIIGFILGVSILTAGSAGAAYYLLTRMGTTPPKPIFAEEQAKLEQTKSQASSQKSNSQSQAETKPKPEVKPEVKPEPKKEEKPEEKLPAGAYRAKVNWSTGLVLRSEPNLDASRIGGVGYNTELIILETSSDQKWQKVRVPATGEEAWVKAGNTEKITENE